MFVIYSNIRVRVSACTGGAVVISPQAKDSLAGFQPPLRAGWPVVLAKVRAFGLLDITWPVSGDPMAVVYPGAIPEDGDGRMVVLSFEEGEARCLTIGYTAQWVP